jgi:single-strand DNA-binding protein
MRSVCRVSLIGNLAADVNLQQTKSGKTVASFPVATNRFSLGADGKKRELTDYHKVIAWNKFGETCSRLLTKGMPVLVEGRLIKRSFEDSDGKTHYNTEIQLNDLNILGWRQSKENKNEITVSEVEAEVKEEDLVAA